MTSREQGRAMVLVRVAGGELTVTDAAALLACPSDRSGGCGRASSATARQALPRRLPDRTRERILALASGRYAGINDTHLAELPAEREAIKIGRSSLQRLLRAAGWPSPRRRRAPGGQAV